MTFFPKKNRVLECLRKNEVPIGLELYTGNASIVEIAAYAGFDFYMLDMEHSTVNIETMKHLITAADAAGITTIVRVPENNGAIIARAVEEGAMGVIVPHTTSAEDVIKSQNALRYPPYGKKGSCTAIRGANYSTAGWEEYLEHHNNEVMLIALLEDPDAINNAEEIFAQLKPGRDAVWFGRCDLAQSLTKLGEKVNWDHPFVLEGFEKIIALSKKTGIPVLGIPWPVANAENCKAVINKGARILLYNIDQLLIYDAFSAAIKAMKA
ncbi:MAG: HpcH/HpaI aldolase family protein [Bacillota bacterium]|jgi:2-keto-3-deoxy-L-rhamnonate aldolase RhmA